jgi:transposase
MASKAFLTRIEDAAFFLATPTAKQAKGYLDQPLETALKVIDCFDGDATCEAIAERTGLHINTVRNVVAALRRGGYPLSAENGPIRRLGRPALVITPE